MADGFHIEDDPYAPFLEKLAKMGLELAQDLATRTQAAEPNEEAAKLAKAFAQVSRGVRQSLALHCKLVRDQQAYRRDFKGFVEQERKEAVAQRRTEVHQTLERVIWDEVEAEDFAHDLVGDLYDALEEESRLSTFLHEPLGHLIDRLRRKLDIDEIAAISRGEFEHEEDEADDDPSITPSLSSSSPALCRGPINTAAAGPSAASASMGGRDKPGHDVPGVDAPEPAAGDSS